MKITTLFLDVGGVILSNGWGRNLRKQVIEHYALEEKDVTDRHNLIFDTYEIGKLTFEEYLNQVIFYKKRTFTLENLREYIFEAAVCYPEMIAYIKEVKEKFGWKVVALTNEGKGLIEDRIKRFDLKSFIDFFVISAHVGLRKPDKDIYRLALGLTQCKPEEILYIDDRALLIEQASSLGIEGICHSKVSETRNIIETKFFNTSSL